MKEISMAPPSRGGKKPAETFLTEEEKKEALEEINLNLMRQKIESMQKLEELKAIYEAMKHSSSCLHDTCYHVLESKDFSESIPPAKTSSDDDNAQALTRNEMCKTWANEKVPEENNNYNHNICNESVFSQQNFIKEQVSHKADKAYKQNLDNKNYLVGSNGNYLAASNGNEDMLPQDPTRNFSCYSDSQLQFFDLLSSTHCSQDWQIQSETINTDDSEDQSTEHSSQDPDRNYSNEDLLLEVTTQCCNYLYDDKDLQKQLLVLMGTANQIHPDWKRDTDDNYSSEEGSPFSSPKETQDSKTNWLTDSPHGRLDVDFIDSSGEASPESVIDSHDTSFSQSQPIIDFPPKENKLPGPPADKKVDDIVKYLHNKLPENLISQACNVEELDKYLSQNGYESTNKSTNPIKQVSNPVSCPARKRSATIAVYTIDDHTDRRRKHTKYQSFTKTAVRTSDNEDAENRPRTIKLNNHRTDDVTPDMFKNDKDLKSNDEHLDSKNITLDRNVTKEKCMEDKDLKCKVNNAQEVLVKSNKELSDARVTTGNTNIQVLTNEISDKTEKTAQTVGNKFDFKKYITDVADKLEQCQITDKLEQSQITDKQGQCQIIDKLEQCQITDTVEQCQLTDKLEQCQITDKLEQCQITEKLEQCQITDKLEQFQVIDKLEQCQITDKLELFQIIDKLEQCQITDTVELCQITDKLEQCQITDKLEQCQITDKLCQYQITDKLEQYQITDTVKNISRTMNENVTVIYGEAKCETFCTFVNQYSTANNGSTELKTPAAMLTVNTFTDVFETCQTTGNSTTQNILDITTPGIIEETGN